MPQIAIEIRDINGLLPGVDRKRIADPFVVDGQNFLVDIDGPVSALGRQWRINRAFNEPRGAQTIRDIDGTILYFTGDAICKYDDTSRQFYPVFRHQLRQTFWPWSAARVGGNLYLANAEVGLIERNPVSGEFKLLTGTYIPTTVYSCTASGGRLILLGQDSIAWSEIDNGSPDGFIPSTVTGAGAQALSIICTSLQPYVVLPFADGFLTYTCSGILRSERVDALNPFRHVVLSRDHIILNPWCVVSVGERNIEEHVMLTKRGFFTTNGIDRPTAWQSIHGEFFHRTVLPSIATGRTDMTTRLDTNHNVGWLCVSVSEDSRQAVYSTTYIYYVPSEKWGVYNRAHTGFIEIDETLTAQGRVYHWGVVDTDGTVYWFAGRDGDFQYPAVSASFVDYTTTFDIPAQFSGLDATEPSYMPSLMLMYDECARLLTNAGTYNIASDIAEVFSPKTLDNVTDFVTVDNSPLLYHMGAASLSLIGMLRQGVVSEPYQIAPLMAEITVGPLRYPQEDKIDFLTEILQLYVGMLDAGLDDIFIDYIADYAAADVTADWNTLDGSEDWGVSAGDNTNYKTELIGTIDGYTAWTTDYGATQRTIPETVSQIGRSRLLSGSVLGMYPYVTFRADESGEFFYLKLLRYTAINAGRLF